jgi:hypothetical protein
MRESVRGVRLALLTLLLIGCSDDGGSAGPAGRGTATCHEWQSALCGWYGMCLMPGVETCNQIKSIACKSDTEAQRCATALRAASCIAPPANCDVRDLADPAPAKKACEDFGAAFCKRSDECQPGSRDACLQEVESSLTCSEFIGVALTFEQCLAEVPKFSCTAPNTPDVCKAILLK